MKWSEADVEVGQIYESTDPRDQRRRIQIRSVNRYDVLNPHAEVVNTTTNRRTKIRLHSLRPTLGKRGWRLVS